MKIAFYHELRAGDCIRFEDILSGRVPASGGMARIWVAVELAKLGFEVSVYHHLSGVAAQANLHGVRAIHIESEVELINAAETFTRNDFLIINYYDGADALIRRLGGVTARKILWAGCNPPYEWCDFLDQKLLHRIVCVSDVCREPYRLHRNFKWVDYIHSSMMSNISLPHGIARESGSVAFLGALREEKGFHHVLRAWPLVRRCVPSAQLYVCGSIKLHFPNAEVGTTGVLTPEFEKKHLAPILEADLDWTKIGIQFLYPQSKQALLERLATVTVGIVNPNLSGATETYCLSAVEMQACGCPCIGGGVGGLLETINHGRSGFHLKTQNPRELAARIVEVLTDAQLRAKLSDGALEHSSLLASATREAQDWARVLKAAQCDQPSRAKRRLLYDLGRSVGLGRVKQSATRALLPLLRSS